MKFLASALAATIAASAFVMTAPPAPARANVFCPVTIATITDLAVLGRQNTYGVLLDFDPGDTASVRMRVDSATTHYAVDFNDIRPIGNAGASGRRYFVLPPGERLLVSAWVESTGLSPNSRMECPITRPFATDAPAPVNPRTLAALEADRRALHDNFSTKTPTVQPTSFGAASVASCSRGPVRSRRVRFCPCSPTTCPPGARRARRRHDRGARRPR